MTGRRHRQGTNLVEIMIVVAILVALLAVVVPMFGMALRLDQRDAASRLALTYERLVDEAMLRNVTFRIAYHLDDNYYEVEVAQTPALLFADPDARLEFEAAMQEKLERQPTRRYAKNDEVEAIDVDDEGLALDQADFAAVQEKFLKRFDMPSGTRISGVYTPAYGDFQEPSGDDPEELEEHEKIVAYSYILPSGIAEHTVIHLTRIDDDRAGYTIEVEPMSGRVFVDHDVRDWRDRFDFVPEEGPDLN